VIFQDGDRRHLGFEKKIEIVTVCPLQRANLRHRAKFHEKSIKRLLRDGDLTVFFSKWRPSAILDLSGAYWDHPRRLLGGLYRCTEFGWNRCCTFDNMKVLIFCAFGLKTPIHAPKIGVLGDLTSLVGSNINVTTKRH